MKDITKEEIIQKIKDIAKSENSNKVPKHKFFEKAGISERKLLFLFGSYNNLILEAGLEPTIFPSKGVKLYTDDELLLEVIKVCKMPNAKLSRLFFEQNSNISPSVCERRFGGWIGTLKLVLEKLDPANDKEVIQKIKEYTEFEIKSNSSFIKHSNNLEHQINSTDDNTVENFNNISENNDVNKITTSSKDIDIYEYDSSNIYGDFINFRGLQHAPVNEQGVVFLFGMICNELGYIVEIVRQGFPDCEAKRKIKNKPGKWQKVRIEFEFQSRSFKLHGHDPNICDVIVCWEHNWQDCPIEVIELKSIIKQINSET